MSTKKRQSTNSNQRWHTRIVSGLTSDTEPCISVHFDTAHYLFNCGEGTTRAFIEQKYGIKKSKAIFLTQVKVSRSGGLAGMLMSLADSGVKNVKVIGPPGLNHFLASTRPYMYRDWMSVNPTETSKAESFEKVYEDELVRVYSYSISPNIALQPQLDQTIQVPSKRKSSNASLRSNSPKRVAREDVNKNPGRLTDQVPEVSLNWQHPSFDPLSLTKEEAAEWRATIVCDMFPGNQEMPSTADPSKGAIPSQSKSWIPRARKSQQSLPHFEGPRAISVVYLVLGPEIRGKFDPAVADALGVAKRDRGKLTRGEPVTVTLNGIQTIVTPEMCMGKSETSTGFLIVDCPTPDYVTSLPDLRSLELVRAASPFVLGSVVHRLGPGVLDDSQYKLWVKGIGTSQCSHLLAGEDFSPNPVSFESSAHLALTLSELDNTMFHIPQESGAKLDFSQVQGLPTNTQILSSSHVTEMTPPRLPTIKPLPGIKTDLYRSALSTRLKGGSLLLSEEQKNSFAQAKTQVTEMAFKKAEEPSPGDDFRVTTLGTGSALPSKYRNVISTLIQIPEYGSIMLDCGENTWGQLCRRFGTSRESTESAMSVLADLQCIFISHVHGDHHMGLSRLLTQRRMLTPAPQHPLYLVLNRVTELCVREYHDLEDLGLNDVNGVKIIQIQKPENKGRSRYVRDQDSTTASVMLDELKGLLGFSSIKAVTVRHRSPSCFGLVARHESGWSFAYSGDTMPCDDLVEAGKNVSLLIHEASMADEEAEKAQEKGHSTIGQAIDVGKRMNAKHLLLTHFSQRYPKVPVITSGLTATALAFDYMTITTSEIWKVEHYISALEHLFEGVAQDDGNAGIE